MSGLHIIDSRDSKRDQTPPLFSELYSDNSYLLKLNTKQTDEIADRAIVDLDPHFLSALIIAGIRSNNLRLITRTLAKGIAISAVYVLEALTAKRKQILLELFRRGWGVNQAIGPTSPPILAHAFDDLEMTSWLLDQGADPNAECDIAYTPLSHAIQTASLEIIHLLLRRGGNVQRGQLMHNAIWRKSENLEVAQLLIALGAPFDYLLYEDHIPSQNMFPFMIETPLHTAVAFHRPEIVNLLLQQGASTEIRNSQGKTVMECVDVSTRERIMRAAKEHRSS